ncbi:MAG: hypothetical protein J5I98_15715 [Phaeodactylibacter sp.]|nr:hypothetical protein [Phaeodactylibacter sp.]
MMANTVSLPAMAQHAPACFVPGVGFSYQTLDGLKWVSFYVPENQTTGHFGGYLCKGVKV